MKWRRNEIFETKKISMINRNPDGKYPQIHSSAFIHPTAIIIGNVKIGKKVFVCPGAVIRADEPKSSIFIGDNCNVQDKVIIHALKNTSVYVNDSTSLSHGCIIHGPCRIGKNCFIGFGSVIFNAVISNNVMIKHLAVIENCKIPSKRIVSSLPYISSQDNIKEIKRIDIQNAEFIKRIVRMNLYLCQRYKKLERK